MKKLFIVICALFVGFAYGANENVPTSKKFVDDALAQKQPKFDGLGNDKLMLYSNTTDGVVASRDIVTTLGNSTSADTVPTVGAINAGLNTKQDTLNGDAGWVAENTGIAGAVVQKPVYSATNNYSNALVEVETLNNAVINAVNSELTVVPGVGWTINTAANLNLLPVPRKYIGSVPDGYTQLEYLESNNTQYINTGILASSENIGIDIKYMPMQELNGVTPENNRQGILGAQTTNYTQPFVLNFTNYRMFLGATILNSLSASVDTQHILKLTTNNKSYYVEFDNSIQHGSYSGSIISNAPIFLFGYGFGERISAASGYRGRIYYCRMTQNDTQVRNFIPARRNTDNVLGMYDTVSGTFFTNAGTGHFIAGPDVN